MVNRHIPTSLTLMPRACNWADPVNTCTEVFSNWRRWRRLSGLGSRLSMIPDGSGDKVAQRCSQAKVTEVQCLLSGHRRIRRCRRCHSLRWEQLHKEHLPQFSVPLTHSPPPTTLASPVKRLRPFPELLAAIEKNLAASKPSFHHSPLEDVTQLLCDGRRYAWVGIYLAVAATEPQPLLEAGADPAQPGTPAARSRILLSIKLGSREIGVLDVESDCPNAFGSRELVFLEQVAEALARYLAGPGRFLVRKAHVGVDTTVQR